MIRPRIFAQFLAVNSPKPWPVRPNWMHMGWIELRCPARPGWRAICHDWSDVLALMQLKPIYVYRAIQRGPIVGDRAPMVANYLLTVNPGSEILEAIPF